MTAAAKTIPELDVLDAGLVVSRIEPADRTKDVAANRAARAPEGEAVPVRVLVNEAVREILVLREKVRRRRPIVVGANQRRSIAALERPRDPGARVRRNDHVGIEEEQDVAASLHRAAIPGHRRAAPFVEHDHAETRIPGACLRITACAVDDDQRLERRGRQPLQTGKTEVERLAPAIRRHDHRDGRFIHL